MKSSGTDTIPSIRLLEKTLEFSSSSIIFTDEIGNISYVNRTFTERTGYSPDEVIGQNPRILKSDRQDPAVYQDLWETVTSGQTWAGQLQNSKKDGTLYWEQATVFPVFGVDQTIAHFVGIYEDISEQKRSETVLRSVGEANQILVRSEEVEKTIPRILEILGKACEADRSYLFNYSEPVSDPSRATISLQLEWNSGAYAPQMGNLANQNIPTNRGVLHDWMLILQSGKPVRGRIDCIPEPQRSLFVEQDIKSLLLIPVHTGMRFFGFIGFDDCHSTREWPDSEVTLLLSVAGSLGVVLQRRNYENDIQEALLKAEASAMEAIRANGAKSAFLATMSHEIRTPLNGILGMTQIMLDDESSEEKRDFLKTIQKSGQSLHSLLNDILDFSRIESNNLDMLARNFSAQSVAQEVVDLFLPSAREKSIDLRLELADGFPANLIGDPDRIRQIISNLVSNAVKFTESGDIIIHLKIIDDPYPSLQIEVSDSGIGVRPEVSETLFDLFTQGDSSNTRRFGGTGIGLAICRRLTEAMKGRIWFESAIDKGSTFFARIPCPTTTQSIPSSSTSEFVPTQPTTRSPVSMHVLVVEDNPVNLRVTELQLRTLGHTFVSVDNGFSAIKRIREGEEFDLILMDCQMPEINGFETTAQIQSLVSPAPKVIALTASASEIDRESARETGISDYLVKPVSKETLKNTIERVMANS